VSKLPSLKTKKVVRALEKAGFEIRRQTGSHITLKNKEGKITTVPMHTKDIKKGLLQAIIKQAGLSVDEFLKLV